MQQFEKVLFLSLSIIILIAVGAYFLTFNSDKSDQQAESQEEPSNEIVIKALTEDLYPLNYLDESTGEVTGIATELLREVLDDTGLSYSFELLPWTEAYSRTITEPNTIIFTMARVPERENKFIWLQKITNLQYSIFTPNKELVDISEEEVKKSYITTTRNDLSHILLKERGFENFIFIKENERTIDLLAKDQIDFVITSHLWAIQNKDELPFPIYPQNNVKFSASDHPMFYGMNTSTEAEIITILRNSFAKIDFEKEYTRRLQAYLND